MTLACKTADLLTLATHALNQVISGQRALHFTKERIAALTHLTFTAQAAARQAEVAHVMVLGCNPDPPERATAEMAGVNWSKVESSVSSGSPVLRTKLVF